MTRKQERAERLMPGGVPKYVRVYDNGETADRYTVIFSGHYAGRTPGRCDYIGMGADLFHPQGIGYHGDADHVIDAPQGWPPAMGRKCHLGTRIPFADLPEPCQRLVIQDYRDLWNLNTSKP